MFESLSSMIAMTIVGGLKYPKVATAFMVAYCMGSYFYLVGYADTSKDVRRARYTNPLAGLKPLGMFGSLFTCVTACVMMY